LRRKNNIADHSYGEVRYLKGLLLSHHGKLYRNDSCVVFLVNKNFSLWFIFKLSFFNFID